MRFGLVCAVLAVLLAGCAASPVQADRQRAALSRRIVDDAVAYNEAYSGAITGQILLNILRAYNRQPRQYMSMTGFTNSEPDQRAATLGVTGLPLDQLGQRWGEGAFGVSTVHTLEPEYQVEPFGADAYAAIALRPTSLAVFRHYWEAGWNRDLLLLVMVDSMEVREGAEVRSLNNSPGTIDADCAGETRIGGCLFVQAARELAQSTRTPPAPARAGACPPIAAYDPPAHAAPSADAPANACAARIEVGARRYTLTLRSLDQMVYYVGELLRRNEIADIGDDGALDARLGVVAPGSYAPDDRVPLFRIVPASADSERDYVATVRYGGRRYSAGAPANRFCFDPSPAQRCRGAARGDRSGTVLELLAGVLAYNQSADAVSAPQASVINAR